MVVVMTGRDAWDFFLSRFGAPAHATGLASLILPQNTFLALHRPSVYKLEEL